LDAIALESTRTIEIDEFVPRSEIDDLYLVRPYYIVPDGEAGHELTPSSAKPSARLIRSPSAASFLPTVNMSLHLRRAIRD
jgi:hypothetical protein